MGKNEKRLIVALEDVLARVDERCRCAELSDPGAPECDRCVAIREARSIVKAASK